LHRFRRHDEHHSVRSLDETAEPCLPLLTGGNVMAIKKGREPRKLQPRDQLIGKVTAVPPRVRDKPLELFAGASFSHDVFWQWMTAASIGHRQRRPHRSAVLGQNRKTSKRANVFRTAARSGHGPYFNGCAPEPAYPTRKKSPPPAPSSPQALSLSWS